MCMSSSSERSSFSSRCSRFWSAWNSSLYDLASPSPSPSRTWGGSGGRRARGPESSSSPRVPRAFRARSARVARLRRDVLELRLLALELRAQAVRVLEQLVVALVLVGLELADLEAERA